MGLVDILNDEVKIPKYNEDYKSYTNKLNLKKNNDFGGSGSPTQGYIEEPRQAKTGQDRPRQDKTGQDRILVDF